MAKKRYLNIGSWNIEHFGKVGDRKESPYAIAEHIEMSGNDIVALQELYVTHDEGGERRNKYLDTTCDLITEHTGDDWEYLIFPNRNDGDKSQLCGVCWNASVVEEKGVYKIPVSTREDSYRLWDRIPHAVKFNYWQENDNEDYLDVVLVSIHMKSNVGKHTAKKRHAEAKTLMDNISGVIDHFNERDIIIIGDTNCLGRDEDAIKEFENRGFQDLNAADSPTYANGNAPFDRAFIPDNDVENDNNEFKYTRQYILKSANPHDHDRFLSDHYMIKITIKGYEMGDAD